MKKLQVNLKNQSDAFMYPRKKKKKKEYAAN